MLRTVYVPLGGLLSPIVFVLLVAQSSDAGLLGLVMLLVRGRSVAGFACIVILGLQ